MLKKIQTILLTCIVLGSLTSCYRMPTDDDCSLVPTTNNPTVTRQRAEPMTPQASF